MKEKKKSKIIFNLVYFIIHLKHMEQDLYAQRFEIYFQLGQFATVSNKPYEPKIM